MGVEDYRLRLRCQPGAVEALAKDPKWNVEEIDYGGSGHLVMRSQACVLDIVYQKSGTVEFQFAVMQPQSAIDIFQSTVAEFAVAQQTAVELSGSERDFSAASIRERPQEFAAAVQEEVWAQKRLWVRDFGSEERIGGTADACQVILEKSRVP